LAGDALVQLVVGPSGFQQ